MDIEIKFSVSNGGEFSLYQDGVLVGVYTAERLKTKVKALADAYAENVINENFVTEAD